MKMEKSEFILYLNIDSVMISQRSKRNLKSLSRWKSRNTIRHQLNKHIKRGVKNLKAKRSKC